MRRVAGAAVRAGAAVVLVASAVAASVTSVSADNDESPYLAFSAPAVGANGVYSVTIAYTSSYTLPSVDIQNADSPTTYVLTGANTAGCAVPTSGGTVSISNPGVCTVSVTATGDPDDNSNGGNSNGHEGPGNDPDSATAALTITVTKASQSIAVTPESGTVGSSLPLVATGYQGTGAITFALAAGGTATGCAISGSHVSAQSAGTCLVTATIAADSNYSSATSAPATMTFAKAGQSITVAPQTGTVGLALTLVATGYKGTGAITFALVAGGTATGCTIKGTSLTVTGAGTCLVTATISADSTYNAATSAPATMTFKAPPKGTLTVVASSETIDAGTPVDETATVIGLFAGDTAKVTSVTFTYIGVDVSYGPSTTAPTNPGTYTVRPSNATIVISPASDAGLYGSINYQDGTLVIRGKVKVTASSGSITAGDPYIPTASVSGLSSGDSATVTTVTFTFTGLGSTSYGPSSAVPSTAGAYSITPSDATISVTPSSHQSHYPSPYTYVSGTLIVDPAPVVVHVNPPPAPPPAVTRIMTVRPFAEGSYALTSKLKAQVMKIARAIRSSHFRQVTLTGYTDNVFTAAFDAVLDTNRADAVSTQLALDLKRLQVHGVVITVVSAPSIVLVATNATAKGRAANRRVVVTLRSR